MYYSNFEDSKSFFADENSGRFHGKVFLLTSHETFSAGVVFSELFRRNNLGVIVGRETGGRVYMESDQRPVVFPRSNLPFLIPVAKLIVGDDDPDRGVIPDITIDLTVEDYINHRDKDMEQVIDLINADPGLVK
jgi:C-terminal processing protease CtpA/Prc